MLIKKEEQGVLDCYDWIDGKLLLGLLVWRSSVLVLFELGLGVWSCLPESLSSGLFFVVLFLTSCNQPHGDDQVVKPRFRLCFCGIEVQDWWY